MTIENALTHDLTYGDGILRVWSHTHEHGEECAFTSVLEGQVFVDIANEDDTDALQAQHKLNGDLATGVPTIEMTLNGVKHNLTWQEAYNLAEMLVRTVNVALYG